MSDPVVTSHFTLRPPIEGIRMTTPPLILERFGAHHRPLIAAWFRLDPETARRLDTSSYAQARAGHDPYVACEAATQAVLGFGVINRDTGQGCFRNVITHPADRRRGIARETIALLVQEARRLGYAGPIGAMVEATHDAALALARSAGFVPDPNPARPAPSQARAGAGRAEAGRRPVVIRGATESLFGRVYGAVIAATLAVVLSGLFLDIPALPPGGFGALPAPRSARSAPFILCTPYSMHGSKADW